MAMRLLSESIIQMLAKIPWIWDIENHAHIYMLMDESIYIFIETTA